VRVSNGDKAVERGDHQWLDGMLRRKSHHDLGWGERNIHRKKKGRPADRYLEGIKRTVDRAYLGKTLQNFEDPKKKKLAYEAFLGRGGICRTQKT